MRPRLEMWEGEWGHSLSVWAGNGVSGLRPRAPLAQLYDHVCKGWDSLLFLSVPKGSVQPPPLYCYAAASQAARKSSSSAF